MSTTQSDATGIDPSYTTALTNLSNLQSNRAITSLFDTPDIPDNGSKPIIDLNAPAIPEMLAWLQRAGHTPSTLTASGLRCVHVAGTKGKGSASALVASILGQYSPLPSSSSSSSPYKAAGVGVVGLYTSPHVLSVRERIVLDGRPISRAGLGRYVGEVWGRFTDAARAEAARKGVVDVAGEADLDGPGTKPFFFRFLTVLALHVFVSEGVRDAVVECGIGGEYDSTNVLPAEAVTAAVVTQLGVDHVGMLGDTVEKIAWHKSGIFKPGVKAFTRRLPEAQSGVMEVLRTRAKEKGATLVEVTDDEVEQWGGVDGAKLQGPFQKYNMALAVYAAREHLLKTGVKLEGRFGSDEWSLKDLPAEFVTGLKEAALRGRCEILEDKDGIEWHVDGAHTDDSLSGVGRWFASRTSKVDVRVLVFNQQERDPAPLLRALLVGAQGTGSRPAFTHAIFTRNEEQKPTATEERDLSVQTRALETMRDVDSVTEAVAQNAVQPAVEQVRHIAAQAGGKPCKVLVTGSFHLVGAMLKIIDHAED
ncbi:folylpolyglutamate synthase [Chaetomidium leptoderma]|uniref:Folylpolyglutamate synthase n=1 Tax=Chaetomidium leptoderma TaxID=669021 RepID=A0AAN6VKN7_9PEZI|nr:folylpolyglutamate synthase [Chaetomidium leptoderma]